MGGCFREAIRLRVIKDAVVLAIELHQRAATTYKQPTAVEMFGKQIADCSVNGFGKLERHDFSQRSSVNDEAHGTCDVNAKGLRHDERSGKALISLKLLPFSVH